MEIHLAEQKLQMDGEINCDVLNCLPSQDKTFYACGITNLPEQWEKCTYVMGEYLEKECEFGNYGMFILALKNKVQVSFEPCL
jgi:hypothetical protein